MTNLKQGGRQEMANINNSCRSVACGGCSLRTQWMLFFECYCSAIAKLAPFQPLLFLQCKNVYLCISVFISVVLCLSDFIF